MAHQFRAISGLTHDERSKAGKLQRPLPNTMLRIVASGEREDPPSEAAQA
jgi:hypothetical protein